MRGRGRAETGGKDGGAITNSLRLYGLKELPPGLEA